MSKLLKPYLKKFQNVLNQAGDSDPSLAKGKSSATHERPDAMDEDAMDEDVSSVHERPDLPNEPSNVAQEEAVPSYSNSAAKYVLPSAGSAISNLV